MLQIVSDTVHLCCIAVQPTMATTLSLRCGARSLTLVAPMLCTGATGAAEPTLLA